MATKPQTEPGGFHALTLTLAQRLPYYATAAGRLNVASRRKLANAARRHKRGN